VSLSRDTVLSHPDSFSNYRIIATPGRLLHLLVEMSLSLSTIQYLVFDEADRLFEMGFSHHLTTILEKLPSTRQTVLFSATLPKSLVDFAKAGLTDPKLVRLDSEVKISQDLRMGFWSVREGERDAALLCLLRDVIKVPTKHELEASISKQEKLDGKNKKKHAGNAAAGAAILAPHQTLIFVSTQHHVAYLSHLLALSHYTVSSIHGTLTQSARTDALDTFLTGQSAILVTTDVAARGIDIPVLENVVNYDFPVGNRVFVHRVGRTARMGRRGWAWSFVGRDEVPFLLDLQLFLGRPLVDRVPSNGPTISETAFTTSLVLAPFPRDALDEEIEYIKRLDEVNFELGSLRGVMERGTKMYNKTRGKASPMSYGRAKDAVKEGKWGFGAGTGTGSSGTGVHPAWIMRTGESTQSPRNTDSARTSRKPQEGPSRDDLLASLASFKPSETVFEMGARGKTAGALLMKERRRVLERTAPKPMPRPSVAENIPDEEMDDEADDIEDVEMANEQDIQVGLSNITHAGFLSYIGDVRADLKAIRCKIKLQISYQIYAKEFQG
jgi:ATP-dependent RNA helicase DDX54/DBP10